MPHIDIIQTAELDDRLTELLASAPMPGLGDGPKCSATKSALASMLTSNGLDGTLSEAALWLLAGELDRSHDVSQAHGSADGSFWHGIMHRREGDYGNSKYWFRRVGKHPVHAELAGRIRANQDQFQAQLPWKSLGDAAHLPEALVDCSQEALDDKNSWIADLETICWWEWQLLFQSNLT